MFAGVDPLACTASELLGWLDGLEPGVLAISILVSLDASALSPEDAVTMRRLITDLVTGQLLDHALAWDDGGQTALRILGPRACSTISSRPSAAGTSPQATPTGHACGDHPTAANTSTHHQRSDLPVLCRQLWWMLPRSLTAEAVFRSDVRAVQAAESQPEA
jgi:hypothetical protein